MTNERLANTGKQYFQFTVLRTKWVLYLYFWTESGAWADGLLCEWWWCALCPCCKIQGIPAAGIVSPSSSCYHITIQHLASYHCPAAGIILPSSSWHHITV